ncbi:MAG: hypothetical protein M1358_16210 [Chloroflexi bacterium]|nr:hypothetical protein [Chloroflexota bacterium]
MSRNRAGSISGRGTELIVLIDDVHSVKGLRLEAAPGNGKYAVRCCGVAERILEAKWLIELIESDAT